MIIASSLRTVWQGGGPLNRAVRTLLLIVPLLLAGCQSERGPSSGTEPTETDYLGRWLVINYWAEWCAPCREEIPELNRLARHQPDRIAVVGINFDGISGAELDRAVEAMGIEFATADLTLATSYNYPHPRVLPTTIIIDPAGNVIHQLQGPQSYAGLLELLTPPQAISGGKVTRPTPAADAAIP